MEDQITFTDVEYGNRKKTTKREKFLNKMEEIIPWKAWVEMIRPYYPKGELGDLFGVSRRCCGCI